MALERGTSGEAVAVLRESVQMARTTVVGIRMEGNAKFRLYFGGRANRICFVLDGAWGESTFNSKSQLII